jgi:predicted HTH transcriptional regulator
MVTGVANPFEAEERLCSLIADSIAPRLVPDVDLMSIEDKTLLSVQVYPSGMRPHFLKKEGPVEGVYIRLGSTNRKADQDLISELSRSTSGTSFDEMPIPDLLMDDLDLEEAKRWFQGIREMHEEELVTLHLLVPMQGTLVPTNGGLLLLERSGSIIFPMPGSSAGGLSELTRQISLTTLRSTNTFLMRLRVSSCFSRNMR